MSRSKEEALAAGAIIAETQHSMKRRKPWHDYHSQGTYMLTIVVEGRQPLLGQLKSSTTPQGAVVAQVELSALGKAIRDEEVPKISAHYKTVEVWKVCIMPDHIHLIIRVREDIPGGTHLGIIIRGFKAGCTQAWWRLMPCVKTQGTTAQQQGTAGHCPAAAPVPAAPVSAAPVSAAPVPAAPVPAVSTAGKQPPSLFEGGYNDKILFHNGQLDNWKHYLDENPRRLAIKRLHPDYFVTTHYTDFGEWHCQTVGNRFLLDIPQKVAVIVHRAYSDQEYAYYCRQWLDCGEAGGVLVSAAISPREKAVMREAMNRGYRIILVRENGFPPLYKPAGESFDACSDGRLLQVCPWDYHMERHTISRNQCLILNRLVEDIVASQ